MFIYHTSIVARKVWYTGIPRSRSHHLFFSSKDDFEDPIKKYHYIDSALFSRKRNVFETFMNEIPERITGSELKRDVQNMELELFSKEGLIYLRINPKRWGVSYQIWEDYASIFNEWGVVELIKENLRKEIPQTPYIIPLYIEYKKDDKNVPAWYDHFIDEE